MMSKRVSSKKHPQHLKSIFDSKEINRLENQLSRFKEIECLAFCSFENRFAKSGGLAAVTIRILPYLKEVNKIPHVVLLTPFYPNIISKKTLQTVESARVLFKKQLHPIDILKYTNQYEEPTKGVIQEFYVKAKGFFAAKNQLKDPYIYDETNSEKNNETLLRNALFFCRCVPVVLQKLGFTKNLLLHLQDWETILVALTAKQALINGQLESCRSLCTLHNPYDSGGLKLDSLAQIIEPEKAEKIRENLTDNLTALSAGLSLTDAPIATVSKNFAKELTSDILHTQHFAPHLQNTFHEKKIIGVNNGMFVNFPAEFSELVSAKKAAPNKSVLRKIKIIKLKKRVELLKILDTYNPVQRFGKLTYKDSPLTENGRPLLPDKIPILLMTGRLDPVQKGFDILLRALTKFKQDELKAVLSPLPIKDSDLDYFYEIAESCSGNITVFPIRMEKGFHELQIGSTYGLMPSIYEPFGAAIEYMANGTVVIARKTGGLVDQVDDGVNGFLFKEPNRNYNIKNIKHFVAHGDNVADRRGNSWYEDLVDSLYKTLKKAIQVYQKENDKYYKMAFNGLTKAKEFKWQKSAEDYFKIY